MSKNHPIIRRTALNWISIPTGLALMSFRSGIRAAPAMTSFLSPQEAPSAKVPLPISRSILTGTWRNDYEAATGNGSEICAIDKHGHYSINGEHWFDIVDFRYDSATQTVAFTKAAIRPADNRRFFNILKIASPDRLIGHYFLSHKGEDVDDRKDRVKYRLEYTRKFTNDGRK